MERQTEVLKNNSHYLRACILYEVLQKKPVFDSYRSFCKTIGDGVMDYVDFEYWFYRFYNGNCDFDHDRGQEPKQKALVELPVEILSMITEEVDPMQRTLFSSLSKLLKTICDITFPKLKNVEISMCRSFFFLSFNDKTYRFWSKTCDSCTLQKNDGPVKRVMRDFLTAAIDTLRRESRMSNLHVEHLKVAIKGYAPGIPLALPAGLHVKTVEIKGNMTLQVMSRLQPGVLEKIVLLDSPKANFAKLFVMDQFKQARKVDAVDFDTITTMEQLKNFGNLSEFEVKIVENADITHEIVTELCDILSKSEVFKHCSLTGTVDIYEIGDFLGVRVTGDVIFYRYEIPDSKEILEFNIEKDGIDIRRIRGSS